jgi:hypothetical protein
MDKHKAKSAIKKAWAMIEVSHARLRACMGPHEFDIPEEWQIGFGSKRFTCKKCGGEMTGLDILKYKNGVNHGRQEIREYVVPLMCKGEDCETCVGPTKKPFCYDGELLRMLKDVP